MLSTPGSSNILFFLRKNKNVQALEQHFRYISKIEFSDYGSRI